MFIQVVLVTKQCFLLSAGFVYVQYYHVSVIYVKKYEFLRQILCRKIQPDHCKLMILGGNILVLWFSCSICSWNHYSIYFRGLLQELIEISHVKKLPWSLPHKNYCVNVIIYCNYSFSSHMRWLLQSLLFLMKKLHE